MIHKLMSGDFLHSKRHGKGTMTYSSGNVYEGDWLEDKRTGHGSMKWFDRNETYTGEWKVILLTFPIPVDCFN